jgi:hypothetical protein
MRATREMIAALPLLLIALSAPSRAAGDGGELDSAIDRVVRWLPSAEIDPFEGGVGAFRTYVVDVETWHRLSVLERDPSRKASFEREAVRRLRKALDAGKLEGILAGPGGKNAFTEMAVLARRCLDHGLDPAPVREALTAHRSALEAEIRRVPVPIRAVYAAYLPSVGITPPVSLEECRRTGMLATQPREVDLTLADIYYLTHEIFAYTDYSMQRLTGMTPKEETYLLRVLPYYAVFYFSLGQVDVASELLTCLQAGGMRDTYGYREGVAILMEHQNGDGSFGTRDSTGSGGPSALLHPTMNALTVLLTERAVSHF